MNKEQKLVINKIWELFCELEYQMNPFGSYDERVPLHPSELSSAFSNSGLDFKDFKLGLKTLARMGFVEAAPGGRYKRVKEPIEIPFLERVPKEAIPVPEPPKEKEKPKRPPKRKRSPPKRKHKIYSKEIELARTARSLQIPLRLSLLLCGNRRQGVKRL